MLSGRHIQVERDPDGNTVVSGNGRVTVIHHGGRPQGGPLPAIGEVPTRISAAGPPDSGRVDPQAPYPGLAPFGEQDAPRFFGRAAEVERLWKTLRDMLRPTAEPAQPGAEHEPVNEAPLPEPRMLAVIGPAGSGKTSLVRAGLIAELARWPLPQWRTPRVVLLRAGPRPLEDLAEALHDLIVAQGATRKGSRGQEAGAAAVGVDELAAQLRAPDGGGRYDKLARLVSPIADPVTAPLILVLDPAEDAYLSGSDPTERFAFADNIFQAAADPGGALTVVLVLRDGSMDAVAAHPQTSQALSRRALLLPAMTTEELRAAVCRPAKEAGHQIDSATEDLLIRECQGLSPCLPPLQLMLSQIWAGLVEGRRPMETYIRLGGVKHGIDWHCEQIYRGLDQQERDLAREAFVSLAQCRELVLVDSTDHPDGVSSGSDRVQRAATLNVLQQFSGPGTDLVVLCRDRGRTTARLSYVVIAEHWRRLRAWLAPPGAAKVGDKPLVLEPAEASPTQASSNRDREPDAAAAEDRSAGPRIADRGLIQRPGQSVDRKPRRSVLVTVLAACLVGALALAGIAEHQRQQIAGERLVAERGRLSALRSQSRYLAQLSVEQAEAGNSETAMLLALEALPKDLDQPDRPFVQDAEGALYRALLSHRELAVLSGHDARIDFAAFSPDGGRIVTASADGSARLWDSVSGRQSAVLGEPGPAVKHAAFSPDGRLVVTASASPEVRLWAVDSGREVRVLSGHQAWVNHAAFNADGSQLISASVDRTARLWEVATGRQIRVLSGHQAWVTQAIFSPDGTRALTASADKTARLWNLSAEAAPVVLSGHQESVDHASFNFDGSRIVTASADGTARLWDGHSGAPLAVLEGHGAGVNHAEFDAGGGHVVTASADGTARLWDARDGRELKSLLGHASVVTHAAFSPDGGRIATASEDGTARLWDLVTGAQIAVLAGHGAWVGHVAFSADGRKLVTAQRDGTARLWDASSGREVTVLTDHQDWINDVAFSPDNALVLTASRDGTARLWQRAGGQPLITLKRHEGWITRAAFSAAGDRVVTASGDATARLWDVASGEVVAVLAAHQGWINHAAFSADGKAVITASVDGTARVWDAADGRSLALLTGHEAWVNHAEFSPDGTRVVTASGDGTARVWDAAGGVQTALLAGHQDWVNTARFSPDGSMIVTASGDGVARLWDAAEGTVLATLTGHREWVNEAAFSPDGGLVVTASADGTARLWHVPDGREVAVLAGHSLGVNQAAFTRDGRRVVTASGDGTARLWDVARGREVITVAGHGAAVNRVALSPDGNWIATASSDGTARIIPLYSTEALVTRARSLASRALSKAERRRFFLEPGQ